MAILTNYEGSNDDFENTGTGYYCAQGFKIPSNATCTGVSIYGSRGNAGGVGASGTFSVSIYSGADPSATLVKTETFNTSVLHAYDGTPYWNDINFTTGVSLVAGTQYYLRIIPLTGSSNDEVRWSTDTTSPTYADGAFWSSNGGAWTQNTSRDKNFRINGTTGHSKTLTETATATATFSRLWTLARTLTEAKTATASLVKMATKRLAAAVTGTDSFTKGLIIASGPNFAGTGANVAFPVAGDFDWDNPSNITADDSSYASINALYANQNLISNYLRASNFGFSIPSNATINGIVVGINRTSGATGSPGNGGYDRAVRLVNASGSVVGDDKAIINTVWPTTFTTQSYGGSSDMWGTSLTANDINDSDFGVVLAAEFQSAEGDGVTQVDFISVTVYYTQPGNSLTSTLTESASATASVIKATTRTIAQSVASAATFARVWTAARSLTESATSTASLVKALTRTAIETITASDNLTALRSIVATLSEGITGTASLIRSSVRQFSETATATDTFTGLRGLFPVFTEAATATASLVKTAGKRVSATAQAASILVRSMLRTLSEAPSAEDTFTGLRFLATTLNETATSVATVVRTTTRRLSETATVTTSFIGAFARILSETATGTASLSAVRHYARTLSDAISASDLFSRAVTYARSFIETATAADTLRRMLNGTVVIWTNIARVVGNVFTNRSPNSTTWTDRERREEEWDNRPRNHY